MSHARELTVQRHKTLYKISNILLASTVFENTSVIFEVTFAIRIKDFQIYGTQHARLMQTHAHNTIPGVSKRYYILNKIPREHNNKIYTHARAQQTCTTDYY